MARNIAPKVAEAIAKSKDLSTWITQSITGLTFTYGKRSGLAISSFDIALEHHDAIVLLIENCLPGSAFSLLRPTFESYIRGVWMLDCAIDSQVEQFAKERFNPAVEKMISELETMEAYSAGIFSKSWEQGKKLFHSFTHAGYRHLIRRMSADGIGANYPEQEILAALGYVDAIAIMAIIAFADICKNEQLAKSALEKSREYAT